MRRLSVLTFSLLACTTSEPDPGPEHVVGLDVELITELDAPVDATPSADGSDIYAVTSSQLVLLRGGEVITLMAGFDVARAVVTDAAGLVYVADIGNDAVFAVDAEGNPTVVPGSEGLDPRALHLGESIHVAGSVDATGAVFELPREGGTPTMVATGFPGDIDGVVVASDGTIYVTGDASSDPLDEGALFEIVDGQPVAIATGITLGTPAGLALTPDDGALMVSALSETGTSEVVIVSRADGTISLFDEVIRENTHSGGLHRAADDPTVYAWADSSDGLGGVYRVRF